MNKIPKNQQLYLLALIVFSVLLSVANIFSTIKGINLSDRTLTLWGIIFTVLTILWASKDAENKKSLRFVTVK